MGALALQGVLFVCLFLMYLPLTTDWVLILDGENGFWKQIFFIFCASRSKKWTSYCRQAYSQNINPFISVKYRRLYMWLWKKHHNVCRLAANSEGSVHEEKWVYQRSYKAHLHTTPDKVCSWKSGEDLGENENVLHWFHLISACAWSALGTGQKIFQRIFSCWKNITLLASFSRT